MMFKKIVLSATLLLASFSPVLGSDVAGGGAVSVLVSSTGTSWIVGE